MIDFSTLQGLSVPEGVVTQISVNGKTVWQKAVTPTGIYDDEFPIEWNSLAVVEAGNATTEFETVPMIKVSNLTPTADEMQAMTLTVHFETESVTAQHFSTDEHNGFVAYSYYESDPGLNLSVCVSDGTVCQSGIYVLNVGGEDMGSSNVDISLTLPVTATHYLYGKEADSVVSYNGVTLPDIETVWTDEVKAELPYAFILTYEDGTKILVVSSYKIEYWETMDCPVTAENGVGIVWELSGGEWANQQEGNSDKDNTWDDAVILWANYDVLESDSQTLYLAASDPVKSYTDPDVFIGDVGYYGAVLPNIDEVYTDELKQTYPYAFTVNWMNSVYFYALAERPATNGTATSKGTIINPYDAPISYVRSSLNTDGNSWRELTAGSLGTEGQIPLPFWANFDVYYADNTVYLSATDPIPVGEIVGYSYNGTILPELPEWDKESYPYAYLSTQGNHYLHLSTVPFKRELGSNGSQSMICDTNGSVIRYIKHSSGDEWERDSDGDREVTPSNGINHWSFVEIYWANFDILNLDGTTHVIATEPIPVYEKE